MSYVVRYYFKLVAFPEFNRYIGEGPFFDLSLGNRQRGGRFLNRSMRNGQGGENNNNKIVIRAVRLYYIGYRPVVVIVSTGL